MTERTYTDEEKARAVLAHCGRPIGELSIFTTEELVALAAIYDQCRAQGGWHEQFDRFASLRRERLEELKATDQLAAAGPSKTIADDKRHKPQERRAGGKE